MKNFILVILSLLIFAAQASAQLLVSDRTTNQISQHDPATGEFLGVLVPGDPVLNGGLFGPSSMTLGPNGDLFVASQFTASVLRYDVKTGDFLSTFADQLNVPSGLLYDEANDELFISTFGNFDSELILRYQGSTGALLSTIGEGTGASGRTAMAIGPDGDLYAGSFANGPFFAGRVLKLDGETFASDGVFAQHQTQTEFLGGANGLTFREAAEEGSFQLDVVGLFSNNVARFDVATTDGELTVSSSAILIADNLDFPSATIDLDDESMLVTNLGNDNPEMGELRPGSIGRFNISTGEFIDTFISAGGEANIAQPTALLLLGGETQCGGDLVGDINGDGQVDFPDFLILSANFGQIVDSFTEGDVDCDGTVEFPDFLILSANFGQSAVVAASSVPEPSGWVVILCGSLFLGSICRSRKN